VLVHIYILKNSLRKQQASSKYKSDTFTTVLYLPKKLSIRLT